MDTREDSNVWESALTMGTSLKDIPYDVRLNEGLCMLAVSCNPKNLKYVPLEVRNDAIISLALEKDENVAEYLLDKPNRQYDIEGICQMLSDEEYKIDDMTLAEENVIEDGLTLSEVGKELRADKQLVLLAVSNNWRAIVYADESLYDDYEVMMTTLVNSSYNVDVFLMCSERLRDNESFVLTSVLGNYKLFKYAHYRLHGDTNLIRELLKSANLHFMKYIRSIDLETLDVALNNPKFSICCLNKELLLDKKIGIYIIGKRPQLAKKLPLHYHDMELLSIVQKIDYLPPLLKRRVENIQDTLDL